MNIPPAGIIESAIEPNNFNPCSFTEDNTPEKDEVSELTSAIGKDTATRLGIVFPLSYDFMQGYQIGLAVARQMLAGSVLLSMKGINPKDLL